MCECGCEGVGDVGDGVGDGRCGGVDGVGDVMDGVGDGDGVGDAVVFYMDRYR